MFRLSKSYCVVLHILKYKYLSILNSELIVTFLIL